jgi:hypothetical protein
MCAPIQFYVEYCATAPGNPAADFLSDDEGFLRERPTGVAGELLYVCRALLLDTVWRMTAYGTAYGLCKVSVH